MTLAVERAPEVVLYEAVLEPIPVHGALTHISGRAVPYRAWTNRGVFMERVEVGAFDKSVREAAAGLPLLLFHDEQSFPVGISEEWDTTRKDGLHGVWRLADDERAQRAAQLAQDGMLGWFSVGHAPIRSEWEFVDPAIWDPPKGPEYMDRVTRLEGRMLETSLVSTPAFPQAQVKLVRSDEAQRQRLQRRPSLRAWQSWRGNLREV